MPRFHASHSAGRGASSSSPKWLERSLTKGGFLHFKVGDEASGRCRALPFTFVFWAVFMITQVGHRQVRLQQSMQMALVSTLRSSREILNTTSDDCAESRRLLTGGGGSTAKSSSSVRKRLSGTSTTSLDDIKTISDILRWLSQSLVPAVWAPTPQGRGVLYEFDKVIGGLRIQQEKLGVGRCPGSESLRRVYNLTCYNRYLEDEDVERIPLLPGSYLDEEERITTWLDLASDEQDVQAQIDRMWDEDFFQGGSQSIWVQSVLLNVQVSLMAYAEVLFFLDRAGRLTVTTKVFTLPTELYGDDWLIWLGDIVMLLMVMGLFVTEVLLYWVAVRDREVGKWWSRTRVLNWGMVVLGTGFSIFFGYLARELTVLSDEFSLIPDPPAQSALSNDTAVAASWLTRQRSMDTVYNEVARLSNLLRWCELSTFWYLLLVLLKFFSVFEGSPRLAMITATLRSSSTDIFHFMVVFAVVFFTFALGAYFLFGHQLPEWSNIHLAMNSSFRALMGDFNFEDMYSIAPISAMVWFWIFMSLIFLVMLNMLLAIVLDTYSSVKETVKDQTTLWEQAREYRNHVSGTMSKISGSERTSPDNSPGRQQSSNDVNLDVNMSPPAFHLNTVAGEMEAPNEVPTPKSAVVQGLPLASADEVPPLVLPNLQERRRLVLQQQQQQQVQQTQQPRWQQQLQQPEPRQWQRPVPMPDYRPPRLALDGQGLQGGPAVPKVPPLGLSGVRPAKPALETPKWFPAPQMQAPPV